MTLPMALPTTMPEASWPIRVRMPASMATAISGRSLPMDRMIRPTMNSDR